MFVRSTSYLKFLRKEFQNKDVGEKCDLFWKQEHFPFRKHRIFWNPFKEFFKPIKWVFLTHYMSFFDTSNETFLNTHLTTYC